MQFFERKLNQIIIAIPSKGRLKQHVTDFLSECGYTMPEDIGRQLQTTLNNDERFQVALIHPKDIPPMVELGRVDVGFSGLDLIYETGAQVRPLIRIGRGQVRMAVAVPEGRDITHPFHLMNRTVGTSFPNMAREYFERLKVKVDIRQIQGASEGMPYLGVVDAIMDVVETGSSLVANHLTIIDDDIFFSECVLMVAKPELQKNYKLVNEFLRSVYGKTNH